MTTNTEDVTLIIDPEFKTLCPPQTHEEFTLLEEQILAEGCRDAIVVWAGHDIILDGHTRHRICDANGIPFDVKPLELPDRQACVEWIVANQLGRRNCSDEQKSYLRGKRYTAEKKEDGKRGKKLAQNEQASKSTAEKLAKEYNVAPATIRRDAEFAQAVDAIAAVAPEAKVEILSGKSSLSKADVIEIAALPVEQRVVEVAVMAPRKKRKSGPFDGHPVPADEIPKPEKAPAIRKRNKDLFDAVRTIREIARDHKTPYEMAMKLNAALVRVEAGIQEPFDRVRAQRSAAGAERVIRKAFRYWAGPQWASRAREILQRLSVEIPDGIDPRNPEALARQEATLQSCHVNDDE